MRTPLLLLTSLFLQFAPVALPAAQAADVTTITRSDFVSMIVGKTFNEKAMKDCFKELSDSDYHLLFTDVSVGHRNALNICMAMRTGLIRGYPDGSFRPDALINVAEAAKIVSRAAGIAPLGVATSVWYAPYIETMRAHDALPKGVKPDTLLTQTNADVMLTVVPVQDAQ